MINLKELRVCPEKFREGLRRKGIKPEIIDVVLKLDKECRKLKTERDALVHQKRLLEKQLFWKD